MILLTEKGVFFASEVQELKYASLNIIWSRF